VIYQYDVFIRVCSGTVLDALLLQNITDCFWLWLCWYWSTYTFSVVLYGLFTSQRDRQHNDQTEKEKENRTNNDLQNTTQKAKSW